MGQKEEKKKKKKEEKEEKKENCCGQDGTDGIKGSIKRSSQTPKKCFCSEFFTDSVLFLPRNKDKSCVLYLVMQLFCFLGYLSDASPNISQVSYQ